MDHCGRGERGRLVGIGVIDGNVEGLVGYLPEECACCLMVVSTHNVDDRVSRTCRPGVSMPAVTTRLEMTKQDMRKGRKTG